MAVAEVTDGVLLDVRGMSFGELDEQDGTALDRALARVLSGCLGTNYNSFGSSI